MDVPREAELRSPLSNEYQSSVVCSVRREDDLDKARKKGREMDKDKERNMDITKTRKDTGTRTRPSEMFCCR